MKRIFESINLGGLTLKNRVIRSATLEGVGDENGELTPEYLRVYENLACGGAGALITGMISIDENSSVFPRMIKAYREGFISDFSELTRIVHQNDCKIIVQLSHCGVKATPDNGNNPVGPSDAMTRNPNKPAIGMSKENIQNVVGKFSEAALCCKDAGADAVQIHSAHGYLLSQFLSPYYNKRRDEYGGSIENRARIVFEVYRDIRSAVGNDYPIFIKINSEDNVEGGLTRQDSLWVCSELEKLGINGIEVSCGLAISAESSSSQKIENENDEGIFGDNALMFAEKLKVPIISVGGYRTPELIEMWLNKGNIQAISMCRPLVSEPDLPNRWKAGDLQKARCVSCNKCFDSSNGFGCKVY